MKQSDVLARKRALVTRIQTEGAEAAYAAALAVCLDPKAPAPARATCATTILRAGGYLSAKEDGAAKEPHEMTPAELQARIGELRAAPLAGANSNAGDDGGGVFD
jgi:hypothetical protein